MEYCEPPMDDPTDNLPPASSPAGLGVEIEINSVTGWFFIRSPPLESSAGLAHSDVIDVRTRDPYGGLNWDLTVDDAMDPDALSPEYILSGKTIKLGTGAAGAAAHAVYQHIVVSVPTTVVCHLFSDGLPQFQEDWDPSSGTPVRLSKTIGDVDGVWTPTYAKYNEQTQQDQRGPWFGNNAETLWHFQYTAPMPLAVVHELFGRTLFRQDSPLIPPGNQDYEVRSNMAFVQAPFFQGLGITNPSPSLMGFFDLVLTYAKRATPLDGPQRDDSVKFEGSIMPRTDFLTIYRGFVAKELQDHLLQQDSLYQILKHLACFIFSDSQGGSWSVDERFCTGSVESPVPNDALDNLGFSAMTLADDPLKFLVADWMKGLQAGTIDWMSILDENCFAEQIGGFGSMTEILYRKDDNAKYESAPIFEFRDVGETVPSNFQETVERAERAIISYHEAYLDGFYDEWKGSSYPHESSSDSDGGSGVPLHDSDSDGGGGVPLYEDTNEPGYWGHYDHDTSAKAKRDAAQSQWLSRRWRRHSDHLVARNATPALGCGGRSTNNGTAAGTYNNTDAPLSTLNTSFVSSYYPISPGSHSQFKGPTTWGVASWFAQQTGLYHSRGTATNSSGNGTAYTTPKPSSSPMFSFINSTAHGTTTFSTAHITPAPSHTISCRYQPENPGLDLNTEFCVCDESITVPLMTINATTITERSQSCDYTALPSTTITYSTPVASSYTDNCHACTLKQGFAEYATCTTILGCTPTVAPTPTTYFVVTENLTTSVGTVANENNGTDFGKKIMDGLLSLCNDKLRCNPTRNAFQIPRVPTIVRESNGDGKVEEITLGFSIGHHQFRDRAMMNTFLARAITFWVATVRQSCQTVDYEITVDDPSDCKADAKPHRRDMGEPEWPSNERRACHPEQDCSTHAYTCKYNATLCSGPDVVTVYQEKYFLQITVGHVQTQHSIFDEFFCSIAEAALTLAIVELAPELLPEEGLEEGQIEATCRDILGED